MRHTIAFVVDISGISVYGPYVSASTCRPGYFTCMSSEGCIPMKRVCDGHFDCVDRTDEAGCTGDGKMLLYVTLAIVYFLTKP